MALFSLPASTPGLLRALRPPSPGTYLLLPLYPPTQPLHKAEFSPKAGISERPLEVAETCRRSFPSTAEETGQRKQVGGESRLRSPDVQAVGYLDHPTAS